MSKANYTNLERLQGMAEFGDECPEATAQYLCGFDFCPYPNGCDTAPPGLGNNCQDCVTKWLRMEAEE